MGGVIPPNDIAELKRRGIAEVFGPDTPVQEIIDFIKSQITDIKREGKIDE